jgi:hypothetical protein
VSIAVVNSDKRKTQFRKITHAVLGYVQAKHIAADFIVLSALFPPISGSPIAKTGQQKDVLCQKGFHLFDGTVDSKTFHSSTL